MPKVFKPAACITCGKVFTPTGPRNKWCDTLCRLLASCDRSGGDNSCWNWQLTLDKNGYGFLGPNVEERFPHRLMYSIIHEIELTEDNVIRHSCDNPACINPLHLVSGSQADNVKDMWDRNRQQSYKRAPKGSEHPMASIDNTTALSIFKAEGTCVEIAAQFGISVCIAESIRRGASWAHVTGAEQRFGRVTGERNINHKLTTSEVLDIYHSTDTNASLGRKYGVSNVTAHNIKTGKAWRHITQS